MLRIVDVEWTGGFGLELEFSDGFRGKVDLESVFITDDFRGVKFSAFSLEDTFLDWNTARLSAQTLRKLAKGEYISEPVISPDDIEAVLKQAAWDAIVMNRPDIFQAAVRGYVEKTGIAKVQKRTRLKSRPSIYKALNPQNSPKLDTLVQLGHAVLEIRGDLPESDQLSTTGKK